MKKRILSVLCVLCMMLSLLPVTAGALSASNTVYVCGIALTDGKCLTSNSATEATDYTGGDNYVARFENDVLYLNGLEKTYAGEERGNRVINWSYGLLTIRLVDGSVNTLEDTNYAAINGTTYADLIIEGAGTLNVKGKSYAIWVQDSITIQKGATVNAAGGTQAGISINSNGDGIYIKQGTDVTASGTYGVATSNNFSGNVPFTIEGGNFTISGTSKALYQITPVIEEGITVYVDSNADGSNRTAWDRQQSTLTANTCKYISMSGFSTTKLASTYEVTSAAATNGTFEVNCPGRSLPGEDVIITAAPNSGYEVDEITVTKAGDSGTTVEVTGNKFTMPEYAVTVAVIFKPTTYTITYNLNEGTNAVENPATYTVVTDNITLAAPERSGYTFGGWFENSGFTGTAVTTIAKGSTGNKDLYAKWTENQGTGTGTVKVAGTDVTVGGYWLCSNNSITKTGASESNYNVKYDVDTKTVTLKNFSYEGNLNGVRATENINIVLEGENIIHSTKYHTPSASSNEAHGIFVTADLTITGTSGATLSVTSDDGNGIMTYHTNHGYAESLTIENADITANAGGDVGIVATETLTIVNSKITTAGTYHGLQGGNFTSSYAADIDITNSEIVATATGNGNKAFQSAPEVAAAHQWRSSSSGTWVAYDAADTDFASASYVELKPGTPTPNTLEDVTFNYAYDVQRNIDYPTKDQEVTATKSTNPYPLDANGSHLTTHSGAWTLSKAGTYFYVSTLGNVDPDLTGIVTAFATNYSVDKDAVVVHELKKDGAHIAYGVVVAYDAAGGYALFVGDTWSYTSGGAGYLLSVNEITDSAKDITATQIATDFVPTCSIELDQTTDYTFTGATVGYEAQTAKTVTVSNTGNAATGALNVTLSGTNADSFTLGDVDATLKVGIALNGSDTFTVVPNTGLSAGTYTATVTVSGQNIASKSFNVSFTVTAPATYNVTVENDGHGTASATSSSAAAGTEITLTATPSTGYKFKEWQVVTNNVTITDNKFEMPSSDVTVKAIFEKETYTISWDTDGDGNVDGTTNVAYGDTPTHADGSKTEDAQYTYTFTGWDPAITAATGAQTYTAQFTPVARSYGVTLNANGGTIADGKNVTGYTYGTPVTLPGVADMTKTGYTFDGWYITNNPGDSDTAVTEISDTYTGDKIFYAKWAANQYIVTLNSQGGTGAPESITVTYDGTYSGLVSPTRPSYTFAGWFTAAEGGTEVTSSTTVRITSSQTLYAHSTLKSDAELEDVTFTHAYDVQRSPAFPAKGDTITLSGFQYPLDVNGDHGTTNEGTWTLTEVGTYYTVKNTASDYLRSVVNGIAGNYTGITADEIVIHELKNGSTHVAYGVVVAYDAASGRAVFLGDTWSGGAGYLLATGTQTDSTDMTATAVPTDFVQAADYRITLDKTGTYTFTAATVGYNAQTPVTVTVSNSGSAATGELTVALSGTNADSFTLSKSSITDIDVSGSDTFTVVPNTDLAAGTYTATVTVSGTNVVPKSFDVTFTVNDITVTFDANGGSVTPTSSTTGADGKLTSLPTPTRSGSYSFKGWYTAANGGTQITTDTVFTENTTIFAQWTYIGGSGGYYPTTYAVVVEDADNGEVSANTTAASKGTTVTIQITPDKGYTLETLTATDRSGKEIELTKVSDGKYTFKMPASKVTVQATFMEDNTMLNFFLDVPANAYYYDAVLWAAKNGITEGTSATTFSPDMACTRAQMVTFLWRAVGSPEPTTNVCPFTDVNLDSYYGKAVLWAVENGITKGTSTTTFSPDMACSRAQMVTFICRMADGKPVSSIIAFTDVPADAYYAESVQWAVENGITNGTGENKFSPDATCTRAQMVTFLYRYFEN